MIAQKGSPEEVMITGGGESPGVRITTERRGNPRVLIPTGEGRNQVVQSQMIPMTKEVKRIKGVKEGIANLQMSQEKRLQRRSRNLKMPNLMASELNYVFVSFDLYLGIESMLISVSLFSADGTTKEGEKKKSKSDMFADTQDMFSDDYAVSICNC